MAFFTRLFGTDLMVSRGITLFSSIGTIYLTYKIGRELYNIYIGLIAAFFFAFSPYVVYSNLVGNFGGIFVFTLSASLYFLILAFKNDKYIHYLLFGLLLGASILLYRLSTVFLLTLPFLFVIIKSSEPLNKLLERTIVAYIGITLSLIPVLVYFTALTDFKYMNATNGIGLILYAYVLFIPVLIFSFILNKYILEKYDSLSKLIGTILITVLIYYSLTQIGSLLSIKERVFYGIVRQALYLVVPSFLFIGYYIKSTFKNQKLNEKIIISLWFLILYFVFQGIFMPPFSNVVKIENNLENFFTVLLILFTIPVLYFVEINENMLDNTGFSDTLIVYVFATLLAFNLQHVQWLVGYFNNYTVIVSLMSAVVLFKIYNWIKTNETLARNVMLYFFIALIIISSIFATSIYATVPSSDRGLELSTVKDVSNYISHNTKQNDEIFTAATIFAVYAERKIVFNIIHPLAYMTPDGRGISDPLPYPHISKIIDQFEINQTKYIIADLRTISLFLSNKQPDLRDYIYKNYRLEKTIDNVKIYKRISINNNSTHHEYFDSFDSNKWKTDSYSSYGIGWRADWSNIHPVLLDQQTYIKYHFNFSGQYDNVALELTGNRRNLRNNLTVYISPDNLSYTKLIEFDSVGDSIKTANIASFIKNNQTWIEFRFYQSSKSDGIPRILDFSITAIPKNNETPLVMLSDKQTVLSKKNIKYNTANLLIESSFEHYKNSNNPPIAWAFTSNNGGVSQIDTNSFDGNYSYRVNIKNATNGIADMSQTIKINGSTYYRFSIAYNHSGSGNALAFIQWFDENMNKIGEDKLNLTALNSWDNAYIEQVTTPNTKYGKIILRYMTTKGDVGTVWFDDVKFVTASND